MVPTVRIRLVKHEAQRLIAYYHSCFTGKLNQPDVRNELIVMAEYYDKLFLKVYKHQTKSGNKSVVYQLPLSISRILHARLQADPWDTILQNVLASLDQELTNMGMKPNFPVKLL